MMRVVRRMKVRQRSSCPIMVDASWTLSPRRCGPCRKSYPPWETALKFSFGRYVTYETTAITKATNPAAAIAISTTRTWNDLNNDYVPDCDLNNPAQNLECGARNNQRFGTPIPTTRYDEDVTEGFGVRPFTWQTSMGVQHELRPGLSVTGGYYHNWDGNYRVTDNAAVADADYSSYCITAPRDARLPGGGGYPVCGLYDRAML